MNEKVSIPKKVADVIEYLRSIGYKNRAIIDVITDPDNTHYSKEVNQYINDSDDGFDMILQALVNGYEIELTPEDRATKWLISLDCVRGKSERDIVRGIRRFFEGGTSS